MNNKKKTILERIKGFIKSFGYYEFVIFIIYVVVACIICISHELSQDEAQSFLIAKNLNYIDIIKQMKYEGHSFLWHFLISPIAKLNLYPDIQKIVPLFFSIITSYLILRKSPFGKITKTLLLFSPGLLYYYSSFARPYCMIPFFLTLIAIIYKDRYNHPYKYAVLLGLLANTHMIMLPVVYILSFCYYFTLFRKVLKKEVNKEEKKNILISFEIFMILFLIILLITIIGYFNCNILTISVMYKDSSDLLGHFFSYLFKSVDRIIAILYGVARRPNELVGVVPKYYYGCFIVFFVLLIFSTVKAKKMSLVFWVELLFIIFVHALFWFILPVRAHIITFMLMFWAWIYYDENKEKNTKILKITLCFLILLTIPGIYKVIWQDLNKNYSTAVETSDFIRKNIKKNSEFIVLYYDFSQLLSLYLGDDYKFYYPNSNRYQTFITWDKYSYKPTTEEKLRKTIDSMREKGKKVYILYPRINDDKMNLTKEEIEYVCDYSIKKIYKSNKKKMVDIDYVFDRVLFDIYGVEI